MNKDEKMILEMLREGKINVDEAERLLDSLGSVKAMEEEPVVAKPINKKFLRVFVAEGDSTKVNINVPVVLAEIALKLVPKDRLKVGDQDISVEQILELVNQDFEGELVNIDTVDDGKEVKVKIVID